MSSLLRPALTLLGLFTLVTGAAYPAVVTGAARAAFPSQAGGSLVVSGGQVVGSTLIGQPFEHPAYFWGRPSATGAHPYDASSSTGSNTGPTNPALREAVAARVAALRAAHVAALGSPMDAPVPVDLVTASASGLDPHISPAAARFQVARVAAARGLPVSRVQELVEAHTTSRTLGVLGEPVVHVLGLNRALDALAGGPPRAQ